MHFASQSRAWATHVGRINYLRVSPQFKPEAGIPLGVRRSIGLVSPVILKGPQGASQVEDDCQNAVDLLMLANVAVFLSTLRTLSWSLTLLFDFPSPRRVPHDHGDRMSPLSPKR
jgi:hypothetical protein